LEKMPKANIESVKNQVFQAHRIISDEGLLALDKYSYKSG